MVYLDNRMKMEVKKTKKGRFRRRGVGIVRRCNNKISIHSKESKIWGPTYITKILEKTQRFPRYNIIFVGDFNERLDKEPGSSMVSGYKLTLD